VAVNEHHPLAKQEAIELMDIADEPMLTLALDKSAVPALPDPVLRQGRLPADDLPGSVRAADAAGHGGRGAGRGADAGDHQPDRLAGRALPADQGTNPPSANLYITYHHAWTMRRWCGPISSTSC
jgi:hypothetical protein